MDRSLIGHPGLELPYVECDGCHVSGGSESAPRPSSRSRRAGSGCGMRRTVRWRHENRSRSSCHASFVASEVAHCFKHDVETDLERVAELVAGLKYVLDGETDEVGVGVGLEGGCNILDRSDELAFGL